MLAGDLLKMLIDRVELMAFKIQDCNCRDPRGTGKCQYGGICRVPIVVIYKMTYKMTNKKYIWNMQQNFKKQMARHFQGVKQSSNSWRRESTQTPTPDTSPGFGHEELLHQCQECRGTSSNGTSSGKATPSQLSKLLANPPAFCVTEKGWKLSNSTEQYPINSSTRAPKCT
jgi:hypothetical protein